MEDQVCKRLSHGEVMAMPFKEFRIRFWYDPGMDQFKLAAHAECGPDNTSTELFVGELVWNQRQESGLVNPTLVFEGRGPDFKPLGQLANELWNANIKPSKHVCNYEETIGILKDELQSKEKRIEFLEGCLTQSQQDLREWNDCAIAHLANPLVAGGKMLTLREYADLKAGDINHGHLGVGDPIEGR